MEPSHTKPNTKRRHHMSAKAAVSGGSEPGSRGSPGVGREGTAPAGVRASGRATLHPEGCRPGCFLGSARAELLPRAADGLQGAVAPLGRALYLPEGLGCFSPECQAQQAPAQAAAAWSHREVWF